MQNQIVTVFGGTGFIGRTLIQKLAAQGFRVRVPVEDPDKAIFLRPLGEPGQISPVMINFGNPKALEAVCQDAVAVVNLIGIINEKGNRTFQRTHATIPAAIANACVAVDCPHFIHISALGSDLLSRSKYAASKARGEITLSKTTRHISILRPSVVFGPNDHFFSLFAKMSKFLPFLPLIGGGVTQLQPIYVGDVADAIIKCVKDPETIGKVYELGGPKVYTLKECITLLLGFENRERFLLSIPFPLASAIAFITQIFPNPILTQDQVILLMRPNVVGDKALPISELGVTLTPLEEVLPTYVGAYAPAF